ncbi:MAG TPA: hypothetical protein VJY65_01320 [Chloroflexota bacterium]|nr:hypothetical protein [Chloroflexota bacterium]
MLADFKHALKRALGIGTGNCLRPGAPSGSVRGRIVRLERDIANDLRSMFAVLLTEHAYSREKRYQALIPILRGDLLPPSQTGLVVEQQEWSRVFRNPATCMVLPVQLVQSVWHPSDIAAETPYVVDEVTLEWIEAEFCHRFELSDR